MNDPGRDGKSVLEVGQIIDTDDFGTHRVERLLGVGGMGMVYETVKLTKDKSKGGYSEKRYAAKAIRREYWNRQDVLDRFYTEAGVLRSHDHENLLPVHGLSWTTNTPEKIPLIFMDLLKGQSLRDTMNGGESFPLWVICTVAKEVSAALQHVHPLGLIHRDIKPENIFLRRRGKTVRVVLMDFGIVKELRLGDKDKGHFVGTDGYSPPEQITGGVVTEQSDIYALACVVYEMFAGRPIFPEVSDPLGLKAAHLGRKPVPLEELVHGVPRPLLDMVMQALEKEPSKRPSSAGIFAAPFIMAFLDETRKVGSFTMEQMLQANISWEDAPRNDPSDAHKGQTLRMVIAPASPPATEPSAQPPGTLGASRAGTDPRWNGPALVPTGYDPSAASAPTLAGTGAGAPPPVASVPRPEPSEEPSALMLPPRGSSSAARPVGELPLAADAPLRTWGAAGAATGVPRSLSDPSTERAVVARDALERSSSRPSRSSLEPYDASQRSAGGQRGPGDVALQWPRAGVVSPPRHTSTTDPSSRALDGARASNAHDDVPVLEVPRGRLHPAVIAVCAVAAVLLASVGYVSVHDLASRRVAAGAAQTAGRPEAAFPTVVAQPPPPAASSTPTLSRPLETPLATTPPVPVSAPATKRVATPPRPKAVGASPARPSPADAGSSGVVPGLELYEQIRPSSDSPGTKPETKATKPRVDF